jgi:hypothetical protein
MLTRRNVSVIVVKAPTISKSPVTRVSCSAQALSLPLDHAMRALAEVGMVSKEFQARSGQHCAAHYMANNR